MAFTKRERGSRLNEWEHFATLGPGPIPDPKGRKVIVHGIFPAEAEEAVRNATCPVCTQPLNAAHLSGEGLRVKRLPDAEGGPSGPIQSVWQSMPCGCLWAALADGTWEVSE